MTLPQPVILAGFSHPNFFVRQGVLKYFEFAPSLDPQIMQPIRAAIKRYGWAEAFEWPHMMTQFPLDADALDWVLEQLVRQDDERPRDTTRFHLSWMVARGDIDIVRPKLDAILNLDLFQETASVSMGRGRSVREHLNDRAALADRSALDCWQQLESLCYSIDETPKEFPSQQIREAELLVERIGQDGMQFADAVLQSLKSSETIDSQETSSDDWWRGSMIRLAGELRLETATEPLLRMFDYDWEWYNEEATKSLIAIGTPDTLRTVEQRFADGAWHRRLYCTEVLESIHSVDAIRLILPLVETEESDDIRCNLAVALASQMDPHGIEPALEIYNENPKDPEREEILRRIFVCATLAELAHPQLDIWHLRLQKSRERFAKISGSVEDKGTTWLTAPKAADLSFEPSIEMDPTSQDEPFEDDWEQSYDPLPPAEPIVREGIRIGRNEPCPCGSGKKYKKCCLRTEMLED